MERVLQQTVPSDLTTEAVLHVPTLNVDTIGELS